MDDCEGRLILPDLRFPLIVGWPLTNGLAVRAYEAKPKAVDDFEQQKHWLNWRRGCNAACVLVTK